MKVTLGEKGLVYSWQAEFPKTTKCVHCGGESRIGFVAHEGILDKGLDYSKYIASLHKNDPKGEGFWLHDCCSVAVYFCKKCLFVTALYNQG